MKKCVVALLTAICLESFCAHVLAEGGCPDGQYPMTGQGWRSCAPIPGYAQQQTQVPVLPAPRWASRWGAIATDASKGVVGSSAGISESVASAERAALNDCKNKGGDQCKIKVSYVNACGAMSVGDKTFNVNWGLTEEEAIDKSMATCRKDDANCITYFTTCSPPERLR